MQWIMRIVILPNPKIYLKTGQYRESTPFHIFRFFEYFCWQRVCVRLSAACGGDGHECESRDGHVEYLLLLPNSF